MDALLDDYLDRIGLAGAAARLRDTVTGGEIVPVLDEVLAAHTAAICFENLDVTASRPIDMSVDAVVDKLVHQRRGGYCHEHAALLRAAWASWGSARPVLARIHLRPGMTEAGGATHQASLVDDDGRPWLTDPGFGAGTPTMALPLDGTERGNGHGTFRVVPADSALDPAVRADSQWVLQFRGLDADDFHDVYAFAVRDITSTDLEFANWYTAAHPGTRFVGQLVIARTRADGHQATLADTTLKQVVRGPKGSREERTITSGDEFAQVLSEVFDLEVDDQTLDAAWQVAQHPARRH